MTAADGKRRKIQAANVEGLLRIIQSIPSSKAEPFKRWLARVGYERLEEIENPELAARRMREIYRAKGYSEACPSGAGPLTRPMPDKILEKFGEGGMGER